MRPHEKVLFVWVLLLLLSAVALVLEAHLPLERWIARESAPAWVQAIGSVAAILVAVAIPYWQRRTEIARARSEATAAAVIAAMEVLARTNNLVTVLRSNHEEAVRKRDEKLTLANLMLQEFAFSAVAFPPTESVKVIAPVMPIAALRLALSQGLLDQAKALIASSRALVEKTGTSLGDWGTLDELIGPALEELTAARDELKQFLVSKVAGEAIAPAVLRNLDHDSSSAKSSAVR